MADPTAETRITGVNTTLRNNPTTMSKIRFTPRTLAIFADRGGVDAVVVAELGALSAESRPGPSGAPREHLRRVVVLQACHNLGADDYRSATV